MFEVGSVVCGAAPSSTVLIVGRALAGIGAAGLFTGATTAVAQVAPIEKRPMIIGLLGGLFGISSIIGPLVSISFGQMRLDMLIGVLVGWSVDG
jgi:MFS family permease